MKIKQWIKLSVACGSLIMLAACSTTHKNSSNIRDANAEYASNDQAETSGMGEETNFGDGSASNALARQLAKRTYYFDFDSYSVRDEDKAAIYANANYLLTHANTKVIVEGHTDPRGSREYNIGLGERRAKAVAALLMAKGVPARNVSVVSYGAEKLATTGRTEADYQQDRRVVLTYIKR